MSSRFTDVLLAAYEKKLLSRVDTLTTTITSGRCTDMVEYKAKCAEKNAYLRALDDLETVVKTYLEEDDDND